MREKRRFSNEGIGGFLESILAVMAVITASSLFLVMLSVGAVQESGSELEVETIIGRLQEQGLWPMGVEKIDLDDLYRRSASLVLPPGVAGIHLLYREMGDDAPLMTFGTVPPEGATVCGERAPMLLNIEGRAVPAMVEVLAW